MSATALLLGLCLALCSVFSLGQCVQRKEYRDTTDEEWDLFREALLSLQNRPSSQNRGYSEWDDYSNFHNSVASQTHGTAMFFPWHRAFLFKLENHLRSLAPKYANVFIPYWSWSTDWANPAASPILTQGSSKNLYVPYNSRGKRNSGRGGRNWWSPRNPPAPRPPSQQPPAPVPQPPAPVPQNSGCLVTCNIPNNHCVRRSYNPNDFPRFYSSEAIAQTIVGNTGYSGFKKAIEGGAHGQVHVSLGGNSGDMALMTSPNDPIFFLHHASLDRMWFLWQQLGSGRDRAYGGSLDDAIPGFGYTARDMVDYNDACVSYQDYSRDGVLSVQALRARQSSGAEEPVVTALGDVDDCLPPPLPDAWLAQNGLTPSEIRAIEQKMRITVTKTQASQQCAKGAVANNNTGSGQVVADDSNSTGTPTTQSISFKSTVNSIPGWGVGLLVLGAAIVVLMAILVVVVMKPRL